ncbi:hypothetical protein [Marinicella sp. W31]|uniref:hypothetical protein n=1 Tax=Marinicella sp. W31 TaxID=3023713 RepID=UPI003756536F
MIEMQLSIAYVEFGGNTGDGAYFYAFSPRTVINRKHNVDLSITFTDSTDQRFKIIELLSTDTQNEFKNPIFTPDQRSIKFTNSNTQKQLISISAMVYDLKREVYLNCDPQVLNSPEV